jgi:hypothetical protein
MNARLGPYELISTLGKGGMGEVFRARDPRLSREVAIKILHTGPVRSEERLRRFQQEARAAGALNHPNVLAVFDVGEQDGDPYVVTELLEGETLRERIERGPLPARKALDVALQLARGLSAAHEKGIIHRDLKPENIFLTRDGHAKILDFGLAKLIEQPVSGSLLLENPSAATEPGVVLGTAGYMAPEQVRGEPADARSDLFALGALLYEMLCGRRAFAGDTRVAILYGIIHKEPQPFDEKFQTDQGALGFSLEAVLRHCLEKPPDSRFQSARDLAFQLEQLALAPSSQSGRMRQLAGADRGNVARRLALAAVTTALLIGAVGGAFAWSRLTRVSPPRFRQLSFRRGAIQSARFAPDGNTVVYAGAFEREPTQLYSTSGSSVESRPLGFSHAELYAISPAGELALGLNLKPGPSSFVRSGTLARVPLAGGAPRELQEDVHEADWAPGSSPSSSPGSSSGDPLAVIVQEKGTYRLELPRGHVLVQTEGWLSHLRVSPSGALVAFIDHPLYGDDRGAVAVVDRLGARRTLSMQYTSTQGLAWRGEDEIWFTGGEGISRALRAVRLDGRERIVLAAPATLQLFDIAKDGRVLLGRESSRAGLEARNADGTSRDLSWLDFSVATAVAGPLFSFFEAGEGGGKYGTAYLRGLDGSPAIKLGSGYAWDLSPDGKTVAQFSPAEPHRLRLVPTTAGEARALDLPLDRVTGARFIGNTGKLVVSGAAQGHGAQLFVLDPNGVKLRSFTPEGMNSVFYTMAPISPDGTRIVAQTSGGGYAIYPLDGASAPQPLPLGAIERPQGWADDSAIYVHRPRELPVRLERLDLRTQQRRPFLELVPADLAGIEQVGPIFLGPDGKVLLYGYVRTLSELYLAEGLR